jgi:hypothetical protein
MSAYFLGSERVYDAMLPPEIFCSLIFEKGVYYNPYLTIDNPNLVGDNVDSKNMFLNGWQ